MSPAPPLLTAGSPTGKADWGGGGYHSRHLVICQHITITAPKKWAVNVTNNKYYDDLRRQFTQTIIILYVSVP